VNVDGQRMLVPEGLYGRRRMLALVRRGHLPNVSPGVVDRTTQLIGLAGVRRDKGIRTTIAGHGPAICSSATAPDRVWVTHITYVRWQRASEGHPIKGGQPIYHSDAGGQCTPLKLTGQLALEGIRPSTGSVRHAYDNALLASINGPKEQ
jgi:putative transposase